MPNRSALIPARLLLRCVHLYHKQCIDLWIRRQALSATCPLCKRGLVPQPRRNAYATRGAGSSRRQRTGEPSGDGAVATAVEEGTLAVPTLPTATPAGSSQAQLEPLLAIEAAADDDVRCCGRRLAGPQQNDSLSCVRMADGAHPLQPRSPAPQQQRLLATIAGLQVEEPSTLTTRLLPSSSG
jgi:hypothetical protein